MAKKQDKQHSIEEFGNDPSFKLDATMRRLLQMSDAGIRKLLKRDQQRLQQQEKKIEQMLGGLPPKATEEQRLAMNQLIRLRKAELRPHRDLVAVIPDGLRPVRIRAIVRFTGNRADLEALGIDVRTQAQDIFTIIGTRNQLTTLAAQAACQRLRTPRMLFPDVDEACTQNEVTAVHAPRPPLNPNGYRGNGVLVGIIDSPLDVTHHGFRDPAGAAHDSRVLYYWVQNPQTLNAMGNPVTQANPPGQTPQQFSNAAPPGSPRPNFNGLNYGRIYTNAFINTAIGLADPYGTANNQICCEPTTTEEHGTHCAGIAAGSGHVNNWNTAPAHTGAAPEATLVYVCLQTFPATIDRDASSEDALVDAINFCLEAGQFHGMPVVLSVSQGTNFGPHNGSTDFDQARDNLINSFNNRSIIWAAGNDNDNDVDGYRRGTVASGNAVDSFTLTMLLTDLWGNPIITVVWLDIWYSGPELDYRITFGGGNTGWRTAGQDYNNAVNGRNIEAERDIEPSGGLRGIRLFFDDIHTNDVFTIELRNPHASQAVQYHAWVGNQAWRANLSGAVHNESTLSDTGCARSILTVGATAKVHPPNPNSDEQVTGYSGAGPTVDGRIKPEIVAVGGVRGDSIISAASDQNSGYIGMNGTSMATPLVAGAAALLFEEYGAMGITLDQDTIKALLITHAQRHNLHLDPSQPGYSAEERNRYGNGRLRMIGAIDHIQPPVDVDAWIRTSPDDYGQEPFIGDCFWEAPDIQVFDPVTGDETNRIQWGTTYNVRITVRNLGDTDATNTTVRLKYARPHTAPDTWFEAEDAANNKLVQTVRVPAMDETEVTFAWRPEASELGATIAETHFCLLAEADNLADPLVYPAPSTPGYSAWVTNIKGVNNIALRNVHIE